MEAAMIELPSQHRRGQDRHHRDATRWDLKQRCRLGVVTKPADDGSLEAADGAIWNIRADGDQAQKPGLRVQKAFNDLCRLEVLVLNT